MRVFALCLMLLVSASAEAYIGPGAGLSVLGSLWAVIVGIVLALFAILSWPIRILWRRLRRKRLASAQVAGNDPHDSESA
jgi:membrane protein implicated in regulation of membrane protease activity